MDHGLTGTTLKVTISRGSNSEDASVLPAQEDIAKSSQVLMKILFSYRGTRRPPHRRQPWGGGRKVGQTLRSFIGLCHLDQVILLFA